MIIKNLFAPIKHQNAAIRSRFCDRRQNNRVDLFVRVRAMEMIVHFDVTNIFFFEWYIWKNFIVLFFVWNLRVLNRTRTEIKND